MKYYDYVDDFNIYNSASSKYNKKKKRLMNLVIILFVICLIVALFIYFYLCYTNRIDKKYMQEGNITVIYENNSFGSKIDSFEQYNSINNSFDYSFSIENDGSNYKNIGIHLNSDYSNNGFLNYSLYKNGLIVFSGIIDSNDILLFNDRFVGNEKNSFVIKIYSDNYNKSFDFNINVEEGV